VGPEREFFFPLARRQKHFFGWNRRSPLPDGRLSLFYRSTPFCLLLRLFHFMKGWRCHHFPPCFRFFFYPLMQGTVGYSLSAYCVSSASAGEKPFYGKGLTLFFFATGQIRWRHTPGMDVAGFLCWTKLRHLFSWVPSLVPSFSLFFLFSAGFFFFLLEQIPWPFFFFFFCLFHNWRRRFSRPEEHCVVLVLSFLSQI